MPIRAHYRSFCRAFLVSDSLSPDDPGVTNSKYGKFMEISGDLFSVTTGKNMKSPGTASVVLRPRRDYLNKIFPNDVIVIYFSEGLRPDEVSAGKSPEYIKNFFGYVDSVRQNVATDANGAPITTVSIHCTDFQKIFNNTAIYVNAFFDPGQDEALKAFVKVWGGVQFFVSGLTPSGTPATMCNTILLNMLGFGAQWQLPQNYPVIPNMSKDITKSENDKISAEFNLQMTDEATTQLAANIQQEKEKLSAKIQDLTDALDSDLLLSGFVSKMEMEYVVDEFGNFVFDGNGNKIPTQFNETIHQQQERQADNEEIFQQVRELEAEKSSLVNKLKNASHSGGTVVPSNNLKLMNKDQIKDPKLKKELRGKKTILDILDRRYIEVFAVDGMWANVPSQNMEGSLWSSLHAWSNPQINELFCDLRLDPDQFHRKEGTKVEPIPAGIPTGGPHEHFTVSDTGASLEVKSDRPPQPLYDEFGVKVKQGWKYVPAVVLRERPFEYDKEIEGVWSVEDNGGEVVRKLAGDLKDPEKIKENFYHKEVEKHVAQQTSFGTTLATGETVYDMEALGESYDDTYGVSTTEKAEKEREAREAKYQKPIEEKAKKIVSTVDDKFKKIKVRFSPVFFSSRKKPVKVGKVQPHMGSDDVGYRDADKTVERYVDAIHITRYDIIQEDLGRSDADLVNLFHMTNNTLGGASVDRTVYRSFTPVFHAESIRRFGLRVMESTSSFSAPGTSSTGLYNALTHLVGRWNMLLDMWALHHPSYLSGTFSLRGRPEIRIGYRLDLETNPGVVPNVSGNDHRNESYYVEGVTNTWSYGEQGGQLKTTVTVTRGQPGENSESRLKYAPPLTISLRKGNKTKDSFDRDRQKQGIQTAFVINSGYRVSPRSSVVRSVKKPSGEEFKGD